MCLYFQPIFLDYAFRFSIHLTFALILSTFSRKPVKKCTDFQLQFPISSPLLSFYSVPRGVNQTWGKHSLG